MYHNVPGDLADLGGKASFPEEGMYKESTDGYTRVGQTDRLSYKWASVLKQT